MKITLSLEGLSQAWAKFVDRGISVEIHRTKWAEMGRPTEITVELKP